MGLEDISLFTSTSQEGAESPNTKDGPLVRNGVFDTYAGGERGYVTQRPSLTVVNDTTSDISIGRGMIYWPAVATTGTDGLYFAVNNDIYRGVVEATSVIASNLLDSATDYNRVYFIDCDTHLVIIDPSANKGYYIASGAPTTVTQITSTNFPGQSGRPNVKLAGGGVYLGGFLFLLGEDGVIYNSNINDILTWGSADLISTELSEDAGVYLAQHYDNIIALGSETCQTFYNAGNVNGSPLASRTDMSITYGCVDHNAVAVSGDLIHFIGGSGADYGSVWTIDNFKPTKIADDRLSEKLVTALNVDNTIIYCSYVKYNNHALVGITIDNRQNFSGPTESVSFFIDINLKKIYEFDSTIGTFIGFPIIDSSAQGRIDTSYPYMLFSSGEVGFFRPRNSVEDLQSIESSIYESGIYLDGIYEEFSSSGESPIEMSITLPPHDEGTLTNKFMSWLRIGGNTEVQSYTANPNTSLEISYSDDEGQTFSTPREYLLNNTTKMSRLGKFVRRIFNFKYSGKAKLKLEKVQVYTSKSNHV